MFIIIIGGGDGGDGGDGGYNDQWQWDYNNDQLSTIIKLDIYIYIERER